MSKRFIKQVIPLKVWRKLGCSLREAWNYMWMNCDEAGVFIIDEDLYEFNNGIEFPLTELKNKLSDWLVFSGEKILIKSFIETNYGNKLRPDYNPHKPLFRAINKHNLKLISSLNQACFKLVDEDVEEEEDEDVEETFEKSEKLLKIEVDADTLLEVSKLKTQIQNEFTWKETICRNIREIIPKFTPEDFDNYLDQFFKTIEGDGEEYKTIQDTKKHFNRWLKIEIEKNNGKSINDNKSGASQSFREKTAKRLGVI